MHTAVVFSRLLVRLLKLNIIFHRTGLCLYRVLRRWNKTNTVWHLSTVQLNLLEYSGRNVQRLSRWVNFVASISLLCFYGFLVGWYEQLYYRLKAYSYEHEIVNETSNDKSAQRQTPHQCIHSEWAFKLIFWVKMFSFVWHLVDICRIV